MIQKLQGIYFGWYIIIVSMIITMLTVGLRLGIGPFVLPMMEDLSLTRTFISLIISVSMIMYGVGMPLAGYLCGKYSTKFVLLLGLVIIELSVLGTVLTNNVWIFFFMYGVLLSFGLAFTSPVAVTPLISRWFVRQRGKALFSLSTGSMAGIAIFNPLATFMIDSIGWRSTLSIFAFIFIIIIVPAAIFIFKEDVPEGADLKEASSSTKSSTDENTPKLTLRDAIRTKAYWQIVAGLFACGFSMNLLGSHAVPMLIDHHFEPTTASFGVGMIGLVAIFSTLVLASIADRFSKRKLLFIIYFIRGLGFLGLVFSQNTWQLYLVAALGGLVWSGSIAMSSAILGELFGVKLLGVLYGWAYLGHQIGGAISSFLGGWGYEVFGTHLFSFGLASVTLIIASIISYLIPEKIKLQKIKQYKLIGSRTTSS
ncbi:MFS transporter [Psychrobacillus lasiicapitis]|uniref:MFS transporter n=1 Tax=Psychrobacillus lasiicapitis TaxID=1636719 RepID=A0A544SYJ2_9BACI|nr:MFS transporter [Psychrobacillus lasiicapitis]TQR10282.1 MFS transporter [Psychrobacillus lasiicapitis]GGA46950.1 MFS transporter [Psychrobacillus lasiicapitis]